MITVFCAVSDRVTVGLNSGVCLGFWAVTYVPPSARTVAAFGLDSVVIVEQE